MKKVIGSFSVALALLLSACSTVNTIYFDRLEAADVSFPEVVRKVGVVNNMPVIEGSEKDLQLTAGLLEGNGKIAAEALAQGLAATDYFDEVLICDSAICPMKVSLRKHQGVKRDWQGNILSSDEATEWMDQLGVDMLMAVERVRIELKEGSLMTDYMELVPTVDAVITPVLRLYIPNRSKPFLTLTKSDTICWQPSPALTFTGIVEESSEYAASLLVPYMIPYWKEVGRHYFDGGNVDMRDAGVYLREHNWEDAALLWKKVYDGKKGKQKMRAAFNLALYHEMQGDFDQAEAYIREAAELARPQSEDAMLVAAYQLQLDGLSAKYRQLRLQMSRFDDKN